MATSYTFNGKLVTQPGTYAETKSGVNNPPLSLSYGNVLIIDKDPSNPFGGGSGIKGSDVEGKAAVYPFDNLIDFRNFIRGGEYYDNALPMFRPAGAGSRGVSIINYVRAFTTTPATLTVTWTGAGALEFASRHEGLCGNGVQGNEVKAKQVLNITAAGAASDTCQITANSVALGVYTQVAGATPATTAAGVASVINANTFAGLAHGYTATASGSQVTVFAPDNTGAAANAYTFAVANTGTLASTVGAATMTGGVNGTKLTRGMAVTMHSGIVDTAKFVLKFWRGSFAGNDSEGSAYNGVAESASEPTLLAESPEFATVEELVNWTKISAAFANNFKLTSSTVTGTGTVTAAHLAATLGNRLFAGGTQTYNTSRIDEIMDAVTSLDYTFVYTLDAGENVKSVDNVKILSSLTTKAKYEKFMVLAGGDDKNTFVSQSIDAAQYYNSDRVIVCHGGCYIDYQESGSGQKKKSAKYKAAYVLGRMCGLPPQTPITFKALGYKSEVHDLSDSEIDLALKKGVLVTGYDSEITENTIIQGINTLQRNDYVLNSDGTSHLISLKRIAAQLNKEIEVNAKRELLGQQHAGPNRSTLSAAIVQNWVKTFLKKREATATTDNLILSSQDITATFNQDSLHVKYAFVPNFEVNKIFITGIIIDPSLN